MPMYRLFQCDSSKNAISVSILLVDNPSGLKPQAKDPDSAYREKLVYGSTT
jgi:hypothetical protein